MILKAEQPKIVVVGSSSIDLVLSTDRFPEPNETILASKSESYFGGKGANQAVATARLGANVYFVGVVGMDPYGQQVMRNLVDEGVNVGYVHETEKAATGTAYVNTSGGKNTIIVVPDANYCLETAHIDAAEKIIEDAELIMVQLEIPDEAINRTLSIAKKHRKPVVLYAAPAKKLTEYHLEKADFIVVKNSEVPVVFGSEPAENLLRRYPNKIFLRGDDNSTTFFNGAEMKYISDNNIPEMHKMGMGDAFTAGFSVALCHGNSIEDCVVFGNRVSLKVAEKQGSQTSLPYLKELR